MFDFRSINSRPVNNLVSNIVYNALPSDIDTVMVDGNVVLEKRRVKC